MLHGVHDDRAGAFKEAQLLARRHQRARAEYCDGNDRHATVRREFKRAHLECIETSIFGARALGKEKHGQAAAEVLTADLQEVAAARGARTA